MFALGAVVAGPAAALAQPPTSGCIARLPTGIYDAPDAIKPAPDAYRIAIVDGCVAVNPGGFLRAVHDRVDGAALRRSWSDGKACHSGWRVTFTGFTGAAITATAETFSTCGGGRHRSFGSVKLRRVAKITGTGAPETLLDHSDVQVGLAALEKVATRQSDRRAAAAISAAIRRGAGKARRAHRTVALRAVLLATSPGLVDALIAAAATWPTQVGDALARTVRTPRQAARLLERVVANTAPGDGARARAPVRALNRLLGASTRASLIARLRKTARGAAPGPALVALSEIDGDRAGFARFVLAGAAASRRCHRGLAFLDVADPDTLRRIDADLVTSLFAAVMQDSKCARVRTRGANLLASVAGQSGAPASLVALAARLARSDKSPDVRQVLSNFASP